ncbi:hypothetical protein [Aquabacterium sp. J223]|uniref:hypothetical protein n=1 Tax=Aquabacterium sp. J223 TaxID=2898431 RepID=UPI0021AD84BE|nr:hypothetical protein [Aquabacterium sp. J223]UUX94269.1 hypothetical protein LRS07_13120 [Aquabacterium sp. J223]
MRIQTTIGLAVAAGVMAGMSIGWRQRQRRQAVLHDSRPAALPAPLQTWEDEGGAVPAPQGQAARVSPLQSTDDASLRDDPAPGTVAG